MVKEGKMTDKKYICTSCGSDATLAYVPETIKRGKLKGEQKPGWDGLIQPGERICMSCGRKRGIRFFG